MTMRNCYFLQGAIQRNESFFQNVLSLNGLQDS